MDGCPLDSFTQLKLNFRRSHSGRTMAAASPVFFPRIFSQYSPSGGTLAAASPRTVAAAATVQLLTTWRNNGGRACIWTMRPPFRQYADKLQPIPQNSPHSPRQYSAGDPPVRTSQFACRDRKGNMGGRHATAKIGTWRFKFKDQSCEKGEHF